MNKFFVALLATAFLAGLGAQTKAALVAYDPAITITTVKSLPDGIAFVNGDDINNNVWTRFYDGKLGIKGKVLWAVPQAQFDQKMNLAIAANDLPDIIPATLQQFKQLVDNGVAMDMTAVFKDNLSPLAKQMFDLDKGVALSQATVKGRLYGIPQLAGNTDSPQLIWIRADWLKKLGLNPPKTIDDLEKIATAFKTRDPDGNGAADTFGLAVNKDLFGGISDIEGFLNGYHGYSGDNDWIKTASGQIAYGAIQPEVKAGLARLQKFYKDGLLDPEFIVKDTSKVNESIVSGKVGIVFGQHFLPFWPLQDAKNADNSADWRPYPIVSADGKPAQPITGGSAAVIYVINKKCKNPEAAVRLLNAYYSKDLPLSADFDDSFHKIDATKDRAQVPVFQYAFVQGWHPQQNLFIHQGVRDYFNGKQTDKSKMIFWVKDNTEQCEAALKGDKSKWCALMWSGPDGAFSVIDKYWAGNQVKVSAYVGASTETMVAKMSTLNKMKLETFTKIILGQPITEFDKFVDNWKKLGGDQITKEVNAAAN
jgi:putative aldouronate transport system substrate-binding protein